jgi:hypothetical protein
MFTADQIFAHLVYAAWPATLLYPIIYGFTAPWWRSWIGRALMVEAIGVFTLLTFSVLYQYFGPGYWGRDFIRISGMAVSLVGFWLVLFALIKVRLDVRRYYRSLDK